MAKKASIHLIAGARPNFVKIAPLWRALRSADWCRPKVIHTGQHADINMSDWFFRDLGLPKPDFHLSAQTGSHARVTGSTMMAYEEVCEAHRPDWCIVVGDVNSTIACSLAAKKLGIRVVHLEAGLRSFDRTMPEEINRVLTDSIADLLWTSSPEAEINLVKEGVPADRVEFVGNIMIDSMEALRQEIGREPLPDSVPFKPGEYGVVTLHRPANVDDRVALERAVDALVETAASLPLVFPVHPRTLRALSAADLGQRLEKAGVVMLPPLGYLAFIRLVQLSHMVITDSGGLQEESSHLGIPCLTLRPNTERPITTTLGTNKLIDIDSFKDSVAAILANGHQKARPIPFWDGKTAERCAASLQRHLDLSPR
jgi:UDP-N-acetylglucosamine 2-epimerase (non-hydrolysing)